MTRGVAPRRESRSRVVTAVVLLVLVGCTDAGIQPAPPPPLATVDDLLTIRGRFCTAPPAEVVFPVKVLMLVDQSASLQCTDSDNRRFAAMGALIDELRPNPHVSFAFVGFSSWSRTQRFTRNRAALDAFLDPSDGLGPATDYQGALATALQLIEADMIDSGPSLRARTKYVVVFVSDGVPEPRCYAGCEDDTSACGDGVDNDGDGLLDASDPDCAGVGDATLRPDSLYGVCNTTEEVPDDVYVDYDGVCPAYNQTEQILQRVSQLDALADTYSVGAVALHTVLLFSPQEVVEGVCPGASASFGYNGAEARALLQTMAEAGGGSFRDANLAYGDRRFFDFDFASLSSRQWLTELTAVNLHARRGPGGLEPDSDTDGLSDVAEAALGTRDDRVESDGGDNYSDLFEAGRGAAGFDANDPHMPAAICDAAGDFDGDRLSNCEEDWLGTAPRDPDTDGDGLLDGLELVMGTDPTVDDAARDLDFDGVSNRDELRGGTDPLVADASAWRADRIRYAIDDEGDLSLPVNADRNETRHCYGFDVSHLRLTTPQRAIPRGLNRVLLYGLERPVALAGAETRTHVACVEARYEGPTAKVPAGGIVDLSPGAWAELTAALAEPVAAIVACTPDAPAPDEYRRDDLVALMQACLPPRVEIDRTLYRQVELAELLADYLDSRLRLRLPVRADQLFVPIESFDDEDDCVRPGELETVRALLERVAAECAPCPEQDDAPTEADAEERP